MSRSGRVVYMCVLNCFRLTGQQKDFPKEVRFDLRTERCEGGSHEET